MIKGIVNMNVNIYASVNILMDLCLFDIYNLLHFTYPQCQK